jgi:hypothetical protein
LVASTTLLIERTPTPSSRCRSHAGEAETLVPRMNAAWKRGQSFASSSVMVMLPTVPLAPERRGGATSSDSVPGIEGRRNGVW